MQCPKVVRRKGRPERLAHYDDETLSRYEKRLSELEAQCVTPEDREVDELIRKIVRSVRMTLWLTNGAMKWLAAPLGIFWGFMYMGPISQNGWQVFTSGRRNERALFALDRLGNGHCGGVPDGTAFPDCVQSAGSRDIRRSRYDVPIIPDGPRWHCAPVAVVLRDGAPADRNTQRRAILYGARRAISVHPCGRCRYVVYRMGC